MPSAAARRMYEDQIPPFMAVFDLDAETMADQETVTVVDPKMVEMDDSGDTSLQKPAQVQSFRPATMLSDSMHKYHDSTSTQASESAESSPTTTLSTTDSSPLSDPSPSSSPDSPVNLIPLNSFAGTSFGGLPPMNTLTIPENSTVSNAGRPMTSPAPRRPKNTKGLSIQPPCISAPRPVNISNLSSEPASPSFIKPTIQAMKRKPSQLSLKTSSSDLMAKKTLEVPSTPALPPILQRRALKHSTSSPHMLTGMKSAIGGPIGGMNFPKVLERNESGLSEVLRPSKANFGDNWDSTSGEEHSPIRSQTANPQTIEAKPFLESEHNEDQKSPGYPDGPVAIYEDKVYLYAEPTAEEASAFDTVINVAREVENPFGAVLKGPVDRIAEQFPPADDSPVPDTAVTTASYATAFEFPPTPADDRHIETPTTPKATTFPLRQPEYIHVPWEHNTDIAQDLMRLCETIEARTSQGKKVLIHCQQGASRSASLIIAYGLYRNPELSVNDAYYAAQAKSKWISPNMRLMYCLQDFQKQVGKLKASPGDSSFRPRTSRSPLKHRLTLSADSVDVPSKEPRTAPLPGEMQERLGSMSPTKETSIRGRRGDEAISPGPSSAPSSFACVDKKDYEEHKSESFRFDLDRLLPQASQDPTSLQLPYIRAPPPAELEVPSTWSSSTKPPPSPGFGAHRFGSFGGLGFASLNLGPSPYSGSNTEQDALNSSTSPATALGGGREPTKAEVSVIGTSPDNAALMSPRAETMTNNPLHEPCNDVAGMHFTEEPPTPSGDGVFSPRATMFSSEPFFTFNGPPHDADPRSPATKGEAPIVRSIDDIL